MSNAARLAARDAERVTARTNRPARLAARRQGRSGDAVAARRAVRNARRFTLEG